jgi:hypothetical protein
MTTLREHGDGISGRQPQIANRGYFAVEIPTDWVDICDHRSTFPFRGNCPSSVPVSPADGRLGSCVFVVVK